MTYYSNCSVEFLLSLFLGDGINYFLSLSINVVIAIIQMLTHGYTICKNMMEDLELWTEPMSIKAIPSEQIKKLAIFQKETKK